MRRLWFQCCLVYTLFGCLTAALMGLLIGAAGGVISNLVPRPVAIGTVSSLAAVLTLREAGVVNFPLPQRRCQTGPTFRQDFGLPWASAMWGTHLGFGITTWITFGGFWLLVAACLFLGDVVYGVAVMVTYWLGRTLTLWTAPFLMPRRLTPGQVLETLGAQQPATYRRLSAVALAWSCVLSGLMLFGRTS
jgi:hypothetical protein